jgi:hypothetical protein
MVMVALVEMIDCDDWHSWYSFRDSSGNEVKHTLGVGKRASPHRLQSRRGMEKALIHRSVTTLSTDWLLFFL